MPRFRRKVTEIVAEQFLMRSADLPFQRRHPVVTYHDGQYWVTTPNGEVALDDGDWVVDNTATKPGDYYPVKPDVFAQLYEAVEE